ncbi:MAG: hypothetical protein WCI57_01480 [Candidatus Berkelbacteria bacterium]
MKTLNILTLAFGLMIVTLMSGCTSPNGPVTPANVWNNYPPKIKAVYVNLEASMITVDFEPYPADVTIKGWCIIPGDNNIRRQIQFVEPVIHGTDNMTGRSNFLIETFDQPWGWEGSALTPGIIYNFMIEVLSADGRKVSKVYQFKDGVVSQIAMTRKMFEELMPAPKDEPASAPK